MKKVIVILILITPFIVSGQVTTGLNTKSPAATLHVKPNGTDQPLKVEGLKAGSGAFLLIDNNGNLKTSNDRSRLTFVLPAVSNDTPLLLPVGSETGEHLYEENSSADGSITGGGSWSKIPQLESTFQITAPKNSINMVVEGMVVHMDVIPEGMKYGPPLAEGANISYAVGIFLDQKLVAVRNFNLIGNNFGYLVQKWEVLGQAVDLLEGMHTVEVYATRRNSQGKDFGTLSVAGLIPPESGGKTGKNQFMTKGVLHINGVYN